MPFGTGFPIYKSAHTRGETLNYRTVTVCPRSRAYTLIYLSSCPYYYIYPKKDNDNKGLTVDGVLDNVLDKYWDTRDVCRSRSTVDAGGVAA